MSKGSLKGEQTSGKSQRYRRRVAAGETETEMTPNIFPPSNATNVGLFLRRTAKNTGACATSRQGRKHKDGTKCQRGLAGGGTTAPHSKCIHLLPPGAPRQPGRRRSQDGSPGLSEGSSHLPAEGSSGRHTSRVTQGHFSPQHCFPVATVSMESHKGRPKKKGDI